MVVDASGGVGRSSSPLAGEMLLGAAVLRSLPVATPGLPPSSDPFAGRPASVSRSDWVAQLQVRARDTALEARDAAAKSATGEEGSGARGAPDGSGREEARGARPGRCRHRGPDRQSERASGGAARAREDGCDRQTRPHCGRGRQARRHRRAEASCRDPTGASRERSRAASRHGERQVARGQPLDQAGVGVGQPQDRQALCAPGLRAAVQRTGDHPRCRRSDRHARVYRASPISRLPTKWTGRR